MFARRKSIFVNHLLISTILSLLLFTNCHTYYYTENSYQFLPFNLLKTDTLEFLRLSKTDDKQQIFKELWIKIGDTISVRSFTLDSTFFDISLYLLQNDGLKLYSEFYAFGYNILFFDIKRNLIFSTKPKKTGKMYIVKKLDAPQIFQKSVYRSTGSAIDTLSIYDTSLVTLRVDVRNKSVFIDKNQDKKVKTKQLLHFYYYPNLGLIYVSGQHYEEKLLNINQLIKP